MNEYDKLVQSTARKMAQSIARNVVDERRRQVDVWRVFFGHLNKTERALNESFERRSR